MRDVRLRRNFQAYDSRRQESFATNPPSPILELPDVPRVPRKRISSTDESPSFDFQSQVGRGSSKEKRSHSQLSRIISCDEEHFEEPMISSRAFFLALGCCMIHTPGFAEVLARRTDEVACAVAAFTSDTQALAAADQVISALRLRSAEDAATMLDQLFTALRKKAAREFQNLVEVVESVRTHKLGCYRMKKGSNSPVTYLKVQAELNSPLDAQLSKVYAPTKIYQFCEACSESDRTIVQKREICKIGKVLVILVQENAGIGSRECYPSMKIKVSVRNNKQLQECHFALSAALSYTPFSNSVSGHFINENHWEEVSEEGKKPSEIQQRPCFLFFYTLIDKNQPQKQELKNLSARLPGFYYVPTLYALLLRKAILKLCFAHMNEGKDSPLSLIAKVLSSRNDPDFSSITFQCMWSKYYSKIETSISTPSQFLAHFLTKIYEQDEKRADKLFSVTFAPAKRSQSPKKNYSKDVERLLHLPVTENLHYRALPLTKSREKSVLQCLELKQKPKSDESATGRINPFHCYVEGVGLKESGALLVCDFYSNGSMNDKVNLHIDHSITVKDKLYELKAVIKGNGKFSAHVEIDGVWYLIAKDSIKKGKLPSTVTNAHVVIYEAVENESLPVSSFANPLPEKNVQIEHLFEFIRRRIETDLNESNFCEKIDAEEKKSPESYPIPYPRSNIPTRGFINIGNSCYFNAMLNCLYYCSDFFRFIIDTPSAPESLHETFCEIFKIYQLTQMDLSPLINKALETAMIPAYQIYDAHKFYLDCLKLLKGHENSDNDRKLNSLFLIKARPVGISCAHCPNGFRKSEMSFSMCISECTSPDLESCLFDTFTSRCNPGTLCNRGHSFLPCSRIISLGSIIVILLEYQTNSGFAFAEPTNYLVLDMNKCLEFGGKYQLFGVVKIIFNEIISHAIAVTKICNQWWCFDDENVTQMELSQTPGKSYILFYQKFQDRSEIVPFSNIAIPSNRPMWTALTALFYLPEIYTFLITQDLKNASKSNRAIGYFFSTFQRHELSQTGISAVDLIPFSNKSLSDIVYDILNLWITEIVDDTENFAGKSSVDKYLKYSFDGKNCAKLHKTCSLLVETQYICSQCFTSNSTGSLEPNYILKLKVPRKIVKGDLGTVFGITEGYFPTISQSYKSQSNLAKYCSRLQQYDQFLRFHTTPADVETVDLYACIQYNYRLILNNNLYYCKQCKGNLAHYTQNFLRFLGTVLVISLIRDGEHGEVWFDQKVRFPYHLDLSEFIEGEAKYELKSFICKFGEDEEISYQVTVSVNGSWYTFVKGAVVQTDPESNIYENVCMLFYGKTANRQA